MRDLHPLKGEAGFRWRGGDPTRVEALTDMVFAFALTLLVVSNAPPNTFPELQQLLWGFPGFAAAFALLLLLWHGHYIFFRRYALEDGWTTTLNAGLLFLIIFFVYPLKYLATMLSSFVRSVAEGAPRAPLSFEEARDALIFVSAGYAAVFFMFALLYMHASAKAETLDLSPAERALTCFGLAQQWVHIVIGLTVAISGVAAAAALGAFVRLLLFPDRSAHVRARRAVVVLAEARAHAIHVGDPAMRSAIAALALTLAACGPAAQPADQAQADATASGAAATAPFTLQRETLIGTWSLDRTCASGDGMRLSADGTAGLGEGYAGTWAIADNNRVVLTLEGYGRVLIQNLDVAYPVADDLIATMSAPDGSGPRGLFARRCSPVPGAAATTQPAAMPAAPFTLQREALIGVWSFDRSCASGDAMGLESNGAASLGEGPSGAWAMADNNRIVLTLEDYEMGVGPTGRTLIYNIDVARPVTDDLIASMSLGDGSGPSGVFARRCPPMQ